MYAHKSDDAWYRATADSARKIFVNGRSGGELPAFQPEEAASPLGCVEQFQLCRESNQNCGPLGSFWDAIVGAAELFDTNEYELVNIGFSNSTLGSRYNWFVNILYSLSQSAIEIPMYPSSIKLLSEQLIQNGIQLRLRDDQWKHDVTQWWSTWRSLVQLAFVETANGRWGSGFPPDSNFFIRPFDEAQQDMCYNQVRPLGHSPRYLVHL